MSLFDKIDQSTEELVHIQTTNLEKFIALNNE